MSSVEPARVVAVIQARTTSTRLPAKVLRPLAGRPVLGWVVRAALSSTEVDEVVVATSRNPTDDPVADLAESLAVGVVRGSEDDVLARFELAARRTGADAVVRLTADCPLLDPALIDHVVALWRRDRALEYVSTVLHRTLPRGLDVELVRADVLSELHARASGVDRVHVTSALYADGARTRAAGLVFAPDHSHLRLTLDEARDAALLEAVVQELGDRPPGREELVRLLADRPDLRALNADVRQKQLEEG